jgi:hypothetical protein
VEEFVAKYITLIRLGTRAIDERTLGSSNVALIRKLDPASPEAEQARMVLAARERLFGKNVYFEFYDKNTNERIAELSDPVSAIPADAKRVLLAEPVDREIEQAVDSQWRFVPTQPPSEKAGDSEIGFLPFVSMFQSGIIVGRTDSIFNNNVATQFFGMLTMTDFGEDQYQMYVKPETGRETDYVAISIKNIIDRLPIDRILAGARMALHVVGAAA